MFAKIRLDERSQQEIRLGNLSVIVFAASGYHSFVGNIGRSRRCSIGRWHLAQLAAPKMPGVSDYAQIVWRKATKEKLNE